MRESVFMSLLSKTAIRSFFFCFFLSYGCHCFLFSLLFFVSTLRVMSHLRRCLAFPVTHAWLRLVCEDLVGTGSSRAWSPPLPDSSLPYLFSDPLLGAVRTKCLVKPLPAVSVVWPSSVQEICVCHASSHLPCWTHIKSICWDGHLAFTRFVEWRWPAVSQEDLPCCTSSSKHPPYCTDSLWGTKGAQHTFFLRCFCCRNMLGTAASADFSDSAAAKPDCSFTAQEHLLQL